jgi:hypothetical protein
VSYVEPDATCGGSTVSDKIVEKTIYKLSHQLGRSLPSNDKGKKLQNDTGVVRRVLLRLKATRFGFECGQHAFGHFLGDDIRILNGKNSKLSYCQCGD